VKSAQRETLNDSLQLIAEGTKKTPHENYFRTLTRSIASSLNIPIAFISHSINPGKTKAKTLALWMHSQFEEDLEYAYKNTPCEKVSLGETCYYPRDVQNKFSKDIWLQKVSAQSYIGLPFFNTKKEFIGHIGIIDTKPMDSEISTRSLSILKIFAIPIGIEFERIQAEKKLQDSNERFRQLTDHIQEVFWMTNIEKMEMLYISPGYEKIWGRTCEGLMKNPKSWMDAIHPEDRERVAQAAFQKQVTGKYDEIYRIIRPNQSMRWIRDRAFPIQDDKKNVYRVCGIAEDITDLKKAQADRERLEEQLRQSQKMEAIGTLAGGIAHDFNNILAGILGNTDLIKIYSKDHEEIFHSAEAIEKASKRAANLTKQLLEFAHKGKAQNIEVNLHHEIHEVVTLMETTLGKSIKVVQKLKSSSPLIQGDPDQIQQIILNLLVNARDAIHEGGEITIQTKDIDLNLKSDPQITESGLRFGKYTQFSVSDSGEGIPKDLQKRIFDPFFTTKKQGKGTGMGLAITYGIVKSHGGTITVQSELNQGTSFQVYLPLSQKAFRESESQLPSESIPGTGKILLIDDEELVLHAAEKLLNQLGYEVVTVGNGREAIEFYKKQYQEIDLVIIDLVMPQISGQECFHELKAINPNIKAILTSGLGFDKEDQNSSHQGIIGFLKKPFQINHLSHVIAKVLDS